MQQGLERRRTQRGGHELSILLRAMGATLAALWTQATQYQKFLYGVGTFLVASAVFHTAVLVVTGGSLEGPISWRKPILFGEAFGLTAVSVAWVMTFLPKRPLVGWLLAGTLGLANFGEVFWVSLQQWRGVPAHFNFSTPFDEAAFSGAGYLIRLTAAVIMIVTVWTFFSLHAPRSVKWAIRVGMVLLVVSQLFGLLTVLNGLTKVRDPQTGAFLPAALESAAIFGAAGAMKVPHALALHAMQVLPLLAWLLRFAPWREEQRTRLVIAGSLGYSGLVGASAFQTFSGLAPLDLRWPVALVGGVSLVLLGTVYALALVGLGQGRTHAAARA